MSFSHLFASTVFIASMLMPVSSRRVPLKSHTTVLNLIVSPKIFFIILHFFYSTVKQVMHIMTVKIFFEVRNEYFAYGLGLFFQ